MAFPTASKRNRDSLTAVSSRLLFYSLLVSVPFLPFLLARRTDGHLAPDVRPDRRISGEHRVRCVTSRDVSKQWGHTRGKDCACAPRVEADAKVTWIGFWACGFSALLSSLRPHCLAPLRENLATTTAADCRKPEQPYDALRSASVDYVKYRGCAQFIGMMMYRLVFLKGITVYLGRENNGMTHCRLIWLADQKIQAEVGHPLSIVFQWDLAT